MKVHILFEVHVLVWCSWRIFSGEGRVVEEHCRAGLKSEHWMGRSELPEGSARLSSVLGLILPPPLPPQPAPPTASLPSPSPNPQPACCCSLMDFSLGLRLGPRNKKATHQQPPAPSGHGPPAASPCLSCPLSACACTCPGCLPPTCSCTAYPYYAATCPSCPNLGPPCSCSCSCSPCPACPPSTCPHSSCVPCSGPHSTCCHPSPCPIYPRSKGQAACPSSCLGYSDGCGQGLAWGTPGSIGHCSCCFRGQRTSQRHCLIV